jgi:hypothetical protein
VAKQASNLVSLEQQSKIMPEILTFSCDCLVVGELGLFPFYLQICGAVDPLQCIRNDVPLVAFLSVIMFVCLHNTLAVSTLLCTQTPVGHYPVSTYTVWAMCS